ncbi:MAG: hypothetical protein ACTSW4_07655 [Candidatus Ranarchaeia archaeon]
MKTIVIVITQGIVVRNLLRTDFLRVLKSNKNLRIILAVLNSTPFYNDDKFVSEFGVGNVIVENIEPRTNVIERLFRKMVEMVFFNINYVDTIRIKEMALKYKSYPSYLLLKFIKKVLGKDKNLIKALDDFELLLFGYKHRYYRDFFEKYKPDLVFATDYLYPHEWGLVKAARHYKVPVISMVASWDHLTKGRLPTMYDRMIVWNDFLKRQLVEWYGYKPENVFITGIPQFDYYVKDRNKLPGKREFMKSIGADPKEKLITYTTSPVTLSPSEQDIIEIICESVKKGEVTYPSHVHVRFHMADDFSRYEKLKRYGNIISFEKAGKSASPEKFIWAPDKEDMLHFAALLKNSDVVLNVCSTVTIDAAAFDTPIINVAFDGYEKKPYFRSILRYYDYTHYQNLMRTKGAKLARNKKELIKYINEYLKNPKLDAEGRRRILTDLCYKLDGKAGERMAEYMINFLKEEGV